MMRITKQRIKEGERYPTGYGLSWIDWVTAEAVCYPIPFNWLARWARDAYYFLARGSRRRQFDAVQRTALQKAGEEWSGALKDLLALVDAWMAAISREARIQWEPFPPAVDRARRLLREVRDA